jgi:hypothetical protein
MNGVCVKSGINLMALVWELVSTVVWKWGCNLDIWYDDHIRYDWSINCQNKKTTSGVTVIIGY